MGNIGRPRWAIELIFLTNNLYLYSSSIYIFHDQIIKLRNKKKTSRTCTLFRYNWRFGYILFLETRYIQSLIRIPKDHPTNH